jgi:ubiquinone/menaquinone biosynthesis C-methylase UbiE
MSDTVTTPDFASIKERQNVAWASGDYSRIGTTLQIVGETLAEALDLPAGATALDVAAGNGNATLALARRGADVISTDYVGALLARGQARAEAEGLAAVFQEADAEALPFADETFDGVASTFGVMFAPNQEAAAAELVRVCRRSGRIGLANWTPDSFIGEVFRLIGRYLPPPAGLKPPSRWGDRDWIAGTFGPAAGSIAFEVRQFVFRYGSPQHGLDEFRTFYGPVLKAFAALEAERQDALEREFLALIERFNTATDGTMRVPSDYAEIVITKA